MPRMTPCSGRSAFSPRSPRGRVERDGVKRLRIEGDNPALYHLVIDAISLGVDVCVVLIVEARESLTRDPVPTRPV
jgi:hypothetical protein